MLRKKKKKAEKRKCLSTLHGQEREWDVENALKELKQGLRRLYTCVHSSITTAKRWKQPKCPWMDDGYKQMCSIHTTEYYSAMKKEGNCDTGYNVDEPWEHDAQWEKPDPKGHTVCDSTQRRSLELSHASESRWWGWVLGDAVFHGHHEFQFCKMKRFWRGWLGWLHDVDGLNVTELYT